MVAMQMALAIFSLAAAGANSPIESKEGRMFWPIQPYFVMNADVYYKYQMRSQGIAHFYRFDCEDDANLHHVVVPDGSVDVIFERLDDQVTARVCGPVTEGAADSFVRGGSYFGVRLAPGEFTRFGDASIGEIVGDAVNLTDIVDDDALCERIGREPDFKTQVDLFIDFLESAGSETLHCGASNTVLGMIHAIEAAGGQIGLDQLEDAFCYSRRQLERRFRQETGFGIKRFCRIVRFQNVLQFMNGNGFESAADLAARFGYFDQAHLLKEFKEFAAESPTAYTSRLDSVHYRDRIRLTS